MVLIWGFGMLITYLCKLISFGMLEYKSLTPERFSLALYKVVYTKNHCNKRNKEADSLFDCLQ